MDLVHYILPFLFNLKQIFYVLKENVILNLNFLVYFMLGFVNCVYFGGKYFLLNIITFSNRLLPYIYNIYSNLYI